MSEIVLSIPEETALALKLEPEAMAAELRLAGSSQALRVGTPLLGGAATLAGIPRPLFLTKLADYGVVTFQMAKDELAEDLARA